MTHTPGPLSIRGLLDYAILDEKGKIIGEAYYKAGLDDQRDAKANAKLWAASPLLLKRLQDARKAIASLPADILGMEVEPGTGHWFYRDELLSNIDKAIAKAKGEADDAQ